METEAFKLLSDKRLLEAAQKGNSLAFGVLYDRHAPACYRHILFRSGSHELSEDVVGQTFLRIWDHLRAGKKIIFFRAFVFQSARNIFIDETRRRSFKNLSLETLLDSQPTREPRSDQNIFQEIKNADDAAALQKALASLPVEYNEIITLRFLDEFSIKEIAEATGKKSGAIYVSLHRGIRLLRQALVEAERSASEKTKI